MLQQRELRKMSGEKFHANAEPLKFSTASVNKVIAPGQVYEGSFTIYGNSGDVITGFVGSSRLCMKVLTEEFSGSKEIINYRFDGTPFTDGDTIEGVFRIISSHGEYTLPYSIKVLRAALSSSLGSVRNLSHFTNLARTDWKDAVRLFYNPQFSMIFGTAEDRERNLYRGLSAVSGNERNVEEFLIAAGRKQAAEFIPAVREISIDIPAKTQECVSGYLNIRRNGWGYSVISIDTEGGFILPEVTGAGEEDFREGSFRLNYLIDPTLMHAGKNLGAIILNTPYKTITIPVVVRYQPDTAMRSMRRRQVKGIRLEMMQCYEAYRLKFISSSEFGSRMDALVRSLMENDRTDPLNTLYRIHYLVTVGKKEEALWDLQELNRRTSGMEGNLPTYSVAQYESESDLVYAYRMYLTILLAQSVERDAIYADGVVSDAIRSIENVHKRQPDNWWITWLYMYAGDEFDKHPQAAWETLYSQYAQGVRSPVLYLEAWQMISANPAIMHETDPFILQVLLYATRKKALSMQVMTQVNALALRQKSFSARLLTILQSAYEARGLESLRIETLDSICRMLIRGNMAGSRWFEWYSEGIRQRLPVTRLYEYYMLSVPEDYEGEIPRSVIMYFAYQSTLPYERNAYLYRYILQHQEENAQVMEQYAAQISSFTLDQLMQQRMNKDLAWLYSYWLSDSRIISGEIAQTAIPAVFTAAVHMTDPNMQRIVLIYDKLRTEQYCRLEDGTAMLPVYGSDNQIFLEDGEGNRYAASVPYTLDHLMDYERISHILAEYETDSFGFDLYMAGQKKEPFEITAKNAGHVRRLADAEEIAPDFRQELRIQLLEYYRNNDMVREIDEFLGGIEPRGLGAPQRSELISYMVEGELQEKALSWIRRYTSFGVDGSTLMKLLSVSLRNDSNPNDPVFAEIAHETFLKGTYDDSILHYMCSYFDGLTEELEKVREAAEGFGTDQYDLCRRMLIQMLYTGKTLPERDEIIDSYIRGGAEREILSSVLAQCAHYYFTADIPMKQEYFDILGEYGRDGVPLVDICRIAWLKDLSEQSGETTAAQREVTTLFLGDLLDRGIVFPFFRQFIGVLPELQVFADETLVEFRPKDPVNGARIQYHYAMERDGQRERYKVRQMKEMYPGVYVAGFLLFFGEQMHYYITDDAAEKNVIESGTIGQDARISADTDDRFGLVNHISMLTALGQDAEAIAQMEHYAHRVFLSRRLFKSVQELQEAETGSETAEE